MKEFAPENPPPPNKPSPTRSRGIRQRVLEHAATILGALAAVQGCAEKPTTPQSASTSVKPVELPATAETQKSIELKTIATAGEPFVYHGSKRVKLVMGPEAHQNKRGYTIHDMSGKEHEVYDDGFFLHESELAHPDKIPALLKARTMPLSLVGNKPTVIVLSSDRCVPCKKEMGAYLSFVETHKDAARMIFMPSESGGYTLLNKAKTVLEEFNKKFNTGDKPAVYPENLEIRDSGLIHGLPIKLEESGIVPNIGFPFVLIFSPNGDLVYAKGGVFTNQEFANEVMGTIKAIEMQNKVK